MHTHLRLPAIFMLICSLSNQALAQFTLGTAAQYGVLASTSITNTGDTNVKGRLGITPGTSIIGFPPGMSTGIDAANGPAENARKDARTAYDDAAALSATGGSLAADIGGTKLVAGTYSASSTLGITGALTLDGQNNPDARFIFQIGSTLTTASASSVILINGAQACNVFWQVGSSATLGTTTTFAGSILALTSITLEKGVTIEGGLYALNAAVTLNDDLVTIPTCAVQTTSTTATVPIDTDTLTSPSAPTSGTNVRPGSGFPTSVPPADDNPTPLPGNDNPAPGPGNNNPAPGPGNNNPAPPPGTSPSKTLPSIVSTTKPTLTSSQVYSTTQVPSKPASSPSIPVYASITPGKNFTQSTSSTILPSSASAWTTSTISATAPTAHRLVTTIHGTPCTTLSYYEAACSCTKTTIVPLAFTPAPALVTPAMELTILNGVPCTTTRYYESECDCVLTSVVPIQVASATASIVTVINGVPCVASKYYDSSCDCVKTAVVPIRTASVGESVSSAPTCTATITAEACRPTSRYLLSCVSACMELYLPASTENVTTTQCVSAIAA